MAPPAAGLMLFGLLAAPATPPAERPGLPRRQLSAPHANASRTPPRPRARPLDVRRGETYDGRRPARAGGRGLLVLPRTLLFLPRAALAVVGNTTVAITDWWEQSGVGPGLRRVIFALGGRLVTLPVLQYELGRSPLAGARLTTDLLFGAKRRAGLQVWGAAGHQNVWTVGLAIHPLGFASPQPTGRPTRRPVAFALRAQFARRDDHPYFGVGYRRAGPGSDDAPWALGSEVQQARFSADVLTTGADLHLRLWRWLGLGLRLGGAWWRLGDGRYAAAVRPMSLVYGTSLADWQQGRAYFTAGARVTFGNAGALGRFLPKGGWRASLASDFHVGDDEAGRHVRLSADVEAFANFLGGRRRLGIRARVAALARLDGRAPPLLALPTLGGPVTMRGFATGRFRGESVIWMAAEYHWALARRLWLSLFVDWGGAFGQAFSGAFTASVDVSGGAGLALRVAPKNWLRLQLAGSRDGVGFWLAWGAEP